MGTTAYGGKGSKGRAANGDRPVGAASCRRDHHTMASCQNPPPPEARTPAHLQAVVQHVLVQDVLSARGLDLVHILQNAGGRGSASRQKGWAKGRTHPPQTTALPQQFARRTGPSTDHSELRSAAAGIPRGAGGDLKLKSTRCRSEAKEAAVGKWIQVRMGRLWCANGSRQRVRPFGPPHSHAPLRCRHTGTGGYRVTQVCTPMGPGQT